MKRMQGNPSGGWESIASPMPGIQLIREKYDDLVGWYDSFCYTHIFTKKVKHNVHEVFSHTKFILQNPLLMKEMLTRWFCVFSHMGQNWPPCGR